MHASVPFYTSTSTLTPPSSWVADQDNSYFASTLFRVGGHSARASRALLLPETPIVHAMSRTVVQS